MNLAQMQKEVMRLVDDKDYDPISVIEYLNKALYQCSIDVDIPDFKRVTNVVTKKNESYTHLGDQILNFGGRVRRVKYNKADVNVYSSLDALLDNYEDLSAEGAVEAVALEGRNLWYAKIPETLATLLVLYFEHPEPLAPKKVETLPWMPEACQLKIIVGGAASLIWNELEEEDSGMPVTNRYRGMYYEGIVDFKQWITKNRVNLTYSHWSY